MSGPNQPAVVCPPRMPSHKHLCWHGGWPSSGLATQPKRPNAPRQHPRRAANGSGLRRTVRHLKQLPFATMRASSPALAYLAHGPQGVHVRVQLRVYNSARARARRSSTRVGGNDGLIHTTSSPLPSTTTPPPPIVNVFTIKFVRCCLVSANPALRVL